jgi:hypothetical protein
MTEIITNDRNKTRRQLDLSGCTIVQYLKAVRTDIFYNQQIQEPETKQNCRLLEACDIGLLVRNDAYAYISLQDLLRCLL